MSGSADLVQDFLREQPFVRVLDEAALQTGLREVLDRCHAAWPTLQVPQSIYLPWLAARLPPGAECPPALLGLFVEDLYLTCGCAQGLPAALLAFEQQHISQVTAHLRSLPAEVCTDDVVAEVRQFLRVRLLTWDGDAPPRISGYSGAGPLSAWVRIVALRRAFLMLREQRRMVLSPADEVLDRLRTQERAARRQEDPEQMALRQRHLPEIEKALRDALLHLDGAERALLRMRYLEGLDLPQIAARLGLSRATVVRRLSSARARTLEGVRRLLTQRLRLSRPECESLLRALHSQIDQSVSQALADLDLPG